MLAVVVTKSPIKNNLLHTKSLAEILKIIPTNSSIQTYNFYSGDLEFSLCEYGNYVTGTTTRYVIYEFWQCMFRDPVRIYNILNDESFAFEDDLYVTLQENWAKFKNQYIRSAMFFMLNRYSKDGLISTGELNRKNYTKVALANLKTFRKPETFMLEHSKVSLNDHVEQNTEPDYRIVNAGNFNFNLFEQGKSYGLEETMIYHDKLLEMMKTKKEKTILIYKSPKRIMKHNSVNSLNVRLINKYGNITQELDSSVEVIIANF